LILLADVSFIILRKQKEQRSYLTLGPELATGVIVQQISGGFPVWLS